MHTTQPEELVLCHIQKPKTGSDVEEEITSYQNQSSLNINIAHHQSTLPHVQVPIPSHGSVRRVHWESDQ